MTSKTGPGPRLPAAVTLPSTQMISGADLEALLGSRAVLSLWRAKYAFPQSHGASNRRGRVTRVSEVAHWLDRFGVEVRHDD